MEWWPQASAKTESGFISERNGEEPDQDFRVAQNHGWVCPLLREIPSGLGYA